MSISKISLYLLLIASALPIAGCGKEDARTAAEHTNNAQQFLSQGDVRSATIEIKNAVRSEPNNPDIRWLAGQIYLAGGQSNAAEHEFTKALELGISRADSDLPLVRTWIAQGDMQKALDHFQTKDLATLSGEAKILYAELLLESGEIGRAEEIFTGLIDTPEENVSAQVGLARIALSRGNREIAQDFVQGALATEPENPFANLIAGELAVTEQRFDEAKTFFATAATAPTANSRTKIIAKIGAIRIQLAKKELKKAEKALATFLSEHPSVPLAYYLQGLTYYQLGESSAAIEALETAKTLTPKHNPTLLLLGKLYLDSNQLELANNVLTILVASDPDNTGGRTLLAATKLRLGQANEALAILGNTVSEESDDLLVLITAGSALLAVGEYSQGSLLLEKAASLADDPRLIRSQLARTHLVSGDVDSAIEEYRELTETDSSNPEHHLLLAYSLIRQGQLDLAMESANQLEAQGLITLSANLKGAIELARQQPAKAKQLFELALDHDPKFVPARLNLARMAMAENRSADAKEMFTEVLAIDPNNVLAILSLADIEIRAGDKPAAIRLLKEAVKTTNNSKMLLALANLMMIEGDLLKAFDYADQAFQTAPYDPAAARTVAVIQAKQGRHLEALETLESIPVSRRNDAFELRMAQLYRINNRPEQARDTLAKLLVSSPNNIDALINAISLELEADEINKAKSLLKTFSDEEEQQRYLILTLQGDIHRAAGQHQQALESYSSAFKSNPNSSLIASIVGELAALDQISLATARLTEWVDQHPEDLPNKLRLANMHMVAGKKNAAISLYEQVLITLPSQPLALNNLAWLYFEQGNSKALKLAEQIADSNPERADVLDTAGWIFINQGDKKRGLRLLTQAYDKAPESADILFHLAVAHQRNDNLADASRLLTELQTKYPAYAQRNDVQAFAVEVGAAP